MTHPGTYIRNEELFLIRTQVVAVLVSLIRVCSVNSRKVMGSAWSSAARVHVPVSQAACLVPGPDGRFLVRSLSRSSPPACPVVFCV